MHLVHDVPRRRCRNRGGRVLALLYSSGNHGRNGDPVGDVDVEVGAEIVLGVVGLGGEIGVEGLIFEETALIGISGKDEVAGHLVSAPHRDGGVALRGELLEEFVVEVHVGVREGARVVLVLAQVLLGVAGGEAVVPARLVVPAGVGVGVDILRIAVGRQEHPLVVLDVDGTLVHVAVLGVHQDDAVGSADTVDGRCGGIFKDTERLYLVGVELGEIPLEPVHDDERGGDAIDLHRVGGAAVEGADTADDEGRLVVTGGAAQLA